MMKSNLSAAFCQRESPGAVPPDPCTQLCSLFQGLTDTQRSFPLAFSKYPFPRLNISSRKRNFKKGKKN